MDTNKRGAVEDLLQDLEITRLVGHVLGQQLEQGRVVAKIPTLTAEQGAALAEEAGHVAFVRKMFERREAALVRGLAELGVAAPAAEVADCDHASAAPCTCGG